MVSAFSLPPLDPIYTAVAVLVILAQLVGLSYVLIPVFESRFSGRPVMFVFDGSHLVTTCKNH